MTRPAFLTEDAERDIDEASLWYAIHGGADLASRFLDALGASLLRLERFPEMHPIVHPGIRRALATPFPYLLIYEVAGEAIIVHRCMHVSREPARWRNRP